MTITDKQKRYIFFLLRKAGYNTRRVGPEFQDLGLSDQERHLKGIHTVDDWLDELTKRKASEVIDILKRKADSSPAKGSILKEIESVIEAWAKRSKVKPIKTTISRKGDSLEVKWFPPNGDEIAKTNGKRYPGGWVPLVTVEVAKVNKPQVASQRVLAIPYDGKGYGPKLRKVLAQAKALVDSMNRQFKQEDMNIKPDSWLAKLDIDLENLELREADFSSPWRDDPSAFAKEVVQRFGVRKQWMDRLRDLADYTMTTHGRVGGDRKVAALKVVRADKDWPLPGTEIVVQRKDGKKFVWRNEQKKFIVKPYKESKTEASYTGEDLARAIASEDLSDVEDILASVISKFDKAAGLGLSDVYSDGYVIDGVVTPEISSGPTTHKGGWSINPLAVYPGGARERNPMSIGDYRKALLKALKSGIHGFDKWVKIKIQSPTVAWSTERALGMKTARLRNGPGYDFTIYVKKKPKTESTKEPRFVTFDICVAVDGDDDPCDYPQEDKSYRLPVKKGDLVPTDGGQWKFKDRNTFKKYGEQFKKFVLSKAFPANKFPDKFKSKRLKFFPVNVSTDAGDEVTDHAGVADFYDWGFAPPAKYRERLTIESGDWPTPKGVNMDTWDRLKSEIQSTVEDVFKKVGWKIVKFDPKNAFYDYLTVKTKEGYVLTIGLNALSKTKDVKQLPRLWPNALKVIDKVKDMNDPFFSTVHGLMKTYLKGGARNGVINQAIMGALRGMGKKIWTD